jgi:hypothetical protein
MPSKIDSDTGDLTAQISALSPLISLPKPFFISPSRWLILFLFCFLNFSNGLLWTTFAPISDISQSYFGRPLSNSTAVNSLSIVFLILFPPGTVLGALVRPMIGLKLTLLLGGGLSSLGSALRLIAALSRAHLSSFGLYSLLLVGSSFAAIAQPVLFNLPAVIASVR